jgi:hypothetical protein
MRPQDDCFSPELLALIARFEAAIAAKRQMIRELLAAAYSSREAIDAIRGDPDEPAD